MLNNLREVSVKSIRSSVFAAPLNNCMCATLLTKKGCHKPSRPRFSSLEYSKDKKLPHLFSYCSQKSSVCHLALFSLYRQPLIYYFNWFTFVNVAYCKASLQLPIQINFVQCKSKSAGSFFFFFKKVTKFCLGTILCLSS